MLGITEEKKPKNINMAIWGPTKSFPCDSSSLSQAFLKTSACLQGWTEAYFYPVP